MNPSLQRIRLIAGQTASEAIRQRLVLLLAAVAVLMMLGSRWLREFNFGAAEVAFIGDFGLGVIGLMGTLVAALATAHLFFDDLAGAAPCVLTRPVRRWEYVVGKFAGVSGLLALFTATLSALLGTLMFWRAQQLGVTPAALPAFLAASAMLWMKFTLVAGMTLCVSAYAGSALFASCAGLMLAVIGHLRPFATGGLQWLRVWPNLGLFDAEALLGAGQPPTGAVLLSVTAYWLVCGVSLLGLASYAFKHREF